MTLTQITLLNLSDASGQGLEDAKEKYHETIRI